MKHLFVWLQRSVMSPLTEASSVCQGRWVEPLVRQLDHPTYLRRGMTIAGMAEPVTVGR